ncbi:MAG TPA: hypothetical protein VJH34_02560 [archaeon]|nr:hypothetical protein [archaeon]
MNRVVKDFVSWNEKIIPESLVVVAKLFEEKIDLKQDVFDGSISYDKLYAYRDVEQFSYKTYSGNIVQYHIGYFNERKTCNAKRCTTRLYFEPQILFSYTYLDNDLDDKNFAYIQYLSKDNSFSNVKLKKLLKQKDSRLIEVDSKEMYVIRYQASQSGFLKYVKQ